MATPLPPVRSTPLAFATCLASSASPSPHWRPRHRPRESALSAAATSRPLATPPPLLATSPPAARWGPSSPCRGRASSTRSPASRARARMGGRSSRSRAAVTRRSSGGARSKSWTKPPRRRRWPRRSSRWTRSAGWPPPSRVPSQRRWRACRGGCTWTFPPPSCTPRWTWPWGGWGPRPHRRRCLPPLRTATAMVTAAAARRGGFLSRRPLRAWRRRPRRSLLPPGRC